MAKTSGGTRYQGPRDVDYVSRSMTPRQVRDNWDAIDKYVNENIDKFRDAIRSGTLPDWVTRDKSIHDTIDLMVRAREVGDEIQAVAEAVAEAHGAAITPINYKGFASLHRKLTNENDPLTIDDIKDAVRNTIVIEKDGIKGVVDGLKESRSFVRHKAQETDYGYSGNIIHVRTSTGLVGEVQVNHPRMIYAKEKPGNAKKILGADLWQRIHDETGMDGGLGHSYYERGRVLPDGSELDEIKRASREYYSHFS